MVGKKLLLATALCATAIGSVSAENWVAYRSSQIAARQALLFLYEAESLEHSAEDNTHSLWTAFVSNTEFADRAILRLIRYEFRCGKHQYRPTNMVSYASDDERVHRSEDAGGFATVIPGTGYYELYQIVCKNKKPSSEAGRFEALNRENRKRIQQYLAKKYDLPQP